MNASQQFAVSVHILTVLAASREQVLTSEEIAGSVGTHPVVIRRILGHLRAHGLVESRPGAAGGWRLEKPPAQIVLGVVYRAVNHEAVLVMHQHPNPGCPVGARIQPALAEVFSAAQTVLEAELAHYTVADMLGKVFPLESFQGVE